MKAYIPANKSLVELALAFFSHGYLAMSNREITVCGLISLVNKKTK